MTAEESKSLEGIEMNEPLRVLHVLNGLHAGGIQSFLVSLHKEVDPEVVQFDYLVRYEGEGIYEPIVKSLGGHVFHVPYSAKHPIRSRRNLQSFFMNHSYEIAHFHYGFFQDITPINIAKRFGVSTRIVHAHSANYRWRGVRERVFQMQHELNKSRGVHLATDRFACSAAAAQWFSFTNGSLDEEWRFIPNGIETDKFVFDEQSRQDVRKRLEISPDSLCLGNVGRLSTAKNQLFLLDIFRKVLDEGQKADLMLVGGGELDSQLREKAAQLNLGRSIHFVGETAGAAEYYNGMDVFVFPSEAEGLGMALVEAQANGLPCIASEAIPCEAIICETTKVLSLNRSAQEWADAIIASNGLGRQHKSASFVRSAGYDIGEVAKELTRFYCDSTMRESVELRHGR